MMFAGEFLDRLEQDLVPADYRRRLTQNVADDWRVFRKGPYLFAAVPYSSVPAEDYRNTFVKRRIREIVFALPFLAEKGLFLLYYGPAENWRPHQASHRVDKTGLRPVIMQSIQFVDPQSGETVNSRTAWGPIKFGFCSQVIEKIERICDEISSRHQ